MRPLQITIAVLFVLKRYNHVKCITNETFAGNALALLFVLKRYNHVKWSTYETVADDDSGIICIQEIQPRKMYYI